MLLLLLLNPLAKATGLCVNTSSSLSVNTSSSLSKSAGADTTFLRHGAKPDALRHMGRASPMAKCCRPNDGTGRKKSWPQQHC